MARSELQRDSDGGQMKEFAAAKFHGLPNTFNTPFGKRVAGAVYGSTSRVGGAVRIFQTSYLTH